ncbi:MAG: NUDIX hydrolase [Planctomycetota bacterium]
MATGFKLVEKKVVLQSRVFSIRHDKWCGLDGRVFERDTVIHPGAVAILAFDGQGRVLMLRQFRPAAEAWLLEIPAGTLEPGEAPLACAKRELIEETGFAARRWRKQGVILNAPGYASERIHLYKAWDLEPAHGEQDADEHIELKVMTMPAVQQAIKSGRLVDAKTMCALLYEDLAIGH